MDSIKFSQKLNQKTHDKNVTIQNLRMNDSCIMSQSDRIQSGILNNGN